MGGEAQQPRPGSISYQLQPAMHQHASPRTLGNFEEILADFLPTFICQVFTFSSHSIEWDPDLILPFFVKGRHQPSGNNTPTVTHQLYISTLNR